MAMAARMPMIATTIISSMRVKPRWFATESRFFVHHHRMRAPCSSIRVDVIVRCSCVGCSFDAMLRRKDNADTLVRGAHENERRYGARRSLSAKIEAEHRGPPLDELDRKSTRLNSRHT